MSEKTEKLTLLMRGGGVLQVEVLAAVAARLRVGKVEARGVRGEQLWVEPNGVLCVVQEGLNVPKDTGLVIARPGPAGALPDLGLPTA